MNKFEAVQQFRASLQAANVPQQQRGTLVRAFNAALALGSDAETRQDARNLTYEVARGEILLRSLSFALGGVSLASAAVMWSRGGDYGGWSFFALVNAFLGGGAVGLIRSVPVMVELRELYAQMAVEVGDWLDEEPEPEPEPREPVVRFDPVAPRHLRRMYYDWRREDLERLDRIKIGEVITRTRLSQLGFPGLTSASQHRPGKYVYNDLIDDMIAKGWIDDDGRWAGRV